jgi:hypothetical protein
MDKIINCNKCLVETKKTRGCNLCLNCFTEKRRLYYNAYNKTEPQKKKRTEYAREYRKDGDNLKKHIELVVRYNNSDVGKEKRKEFEKTDKYKSWVKRNNKEKYKTNENFRLNRCLRSRIRMALGGYKKSNKTKELIGLDIVEFKKHLESKFQDGMSWSNYGYYGWHIDHIKPCSLFDLSKEEDQKQCFHYTNMQPLWRLDNMKKSNKY